MPRHSSAPFPFLAEQKNGCALYVGVVVFGTPQEWLRSALLFGEAIGFGV